MLNGKLESSLEACDQVLLTHIEVVEMLQDTTCKPSVLQVEGGHSQAYVCPALVGQVVHGTCNSSEV